MEVERVSPGRIVTIYFTMSFSFVRRSTINGERETCYYRDNVSCDNVNSQDIFTHLVEYHDDDDDDDERDLLLQGTM